MKIRVGNYFRLKNESGLCLFKVTELSDISIKLEHYKQCIVELTLEEFYEAVKPIELDDKKLWLGFDFTSNGMMSMSRHYGNDFIFVLKGTPEYYKPMYYIRDESKNEADRWVRLDDKIVYMHELQNLFFKIRNEEIHIDEPVLNFNPYPVIYSKTPLLIDIANK